LGGPAEAESAGPESFISGVLPLPEGHSHLLAPVGRRFRIRRLISAAPYP
jgi:hypothetical protein